MRATTGSTDMKGVGVTGGTATRGLVTARNIGDTFGCSIVAMKLLPTSSCRRWRSRNRPSSMKELNPVLNISVKLRPGVVGKPCNRMRAA